MVLHISHRQRRIQNMTRMKRIGGSTHTETMKKTDTQSGKLETESAKSAHSRRREQVRRAQRYVPQFVIVRETDRPAF